MSLATIDSLLADFEFLEEWEDRYKYIIELGRALEPLPEADHTAENKVQGCASQVWIKTELRDGLMHFTGDSDAIIVKGLIAVVFALYNNKPASFIATTEAAPFLQKLGLSDHLSPQRSNGLKSMVARMQRDARAAA